jgi:hypothetical protein
MLGDRGEVAIIVQQRVAMLDAIGADKDFDRVLIVMPILRKA